MVACHAFEWKSVNQHLSRVNSSSHDLIQIPAHSVICKQNNSRHKHGSAPSGAGDSGAGGQQHDRTSLTVQLPLIQNL